MNLNEQRNNTKYKIIRFTIILIMVLSVALNIQYMLKYDKLQDLYLQCAEGKVVSEAEAVVKSIQNHQENINIKNRTLDSTEREVIKDLEGKAIIKAKTHH